MEATYWEIWYKSVEGNTRWAIIKAPADLSEYDIKSRIIDNSGGCGDDVNEIISLHETYEQDWSWDYTQ